MATSFNADGLSIVDSYFGIDAADQDVTTIAKNADDRGQPSKVPHGPMKDFLKTSLKRRRQNQENDLDDDVDRIHSASEGEEEGRTYISKSRSSRRSVSSTKDDPHATTEESRKRANASKETPKTDSHEKTLDKFKKDVAPAGGAAEQSNDVPDDPVDTVPPRGRYHRRKKCRSRQKNIRKDNRDVKPSFTHDPTAPGYQPLTVETKEYLRHKNLLKSSSSLPSNSIIAKLNNTESS